MKTKLERMQDQISLADNAFENRREKNLNVKKKKR